MKRITAATILLTALVFTVAAAKQSPDTPTCGDRGLLLRISVPEGPHKAKAKIPLTFTVANTNQNDVYLPIGFTYARDFDKDAKTCVIGSGTFILCQKRYRRGDYLKFKGAYPKVNGTGQTVKAGQEIEAYSIDLAKCFDLSSGQYDVQLLFTRRYSGFLDGASNRITITVE